MNKASCLNQSSATPMADAQIVRASLPAITAVLESLLLQSIDCHCLAAIHPGLVLGYPLFAPVRH